MNVYMSSTMRMSMSVCGYDYEYDCDLRPPIDGWTDGYLCTMHDFTKH